MNRHTRAILYRIADNKAVQTVVGIAAVLALFNAPFIAWCLR